MADPVQFNLSPDDLPTAWYNVLPDMAAAGMQPLPPLHPGTKEPVTPDLLAPLFPESLIMQEVSTETGAGQWGSALAMACSFFDLECLVFMVRASYEQKPYRRVFIEMFGAEVRPSPTSTTQSGKKILEE